MLKGFGIIQNLFLFHQLGSTEGDTVCVPIANLLTYKNRDPVLDRKASQADPLLSIFLGLKWGEVIFEGACYFLSPTFS